MSPTGKGSCVVLRYPDTKSERQLLQFGDPIEVPAPETVFRPPLTGGSFTPSRGRNFAVRFR